MSEPLKVIAWECRPKPEGWNGLPPKEHIAAMLDDIYTENPYWEPHRALVYKEEAERQLRNARRVVEQLESKQKHNREELTKAERELRRLRAACSRENDTISQVLGRALGYPRFADDQKNFPGATDADGVCVGDHVAASLADEAANVIRELRAEVERLRADLPAAYQRGYTEALNDCIRNGGEQWARSMFADGGDAIDAARAAQEGE